MLQPCSVADWNSCMIDNVSTPVTVVVGSDAYNQIVAYIAGLAPINDIHILTKYDPDSVLSYCSPREFFGEWARPTAYDLLGMEMLYPPSVTFPVGCDTGCLHSATGLITRQDGAVTTSWTERGGVDVTLLSAIDAQNVATLPTSSLAAGSSTLQFLFNTIRTTGLRLASATLLNSNAQHTAIVNAIMGID